MTELICHETRRMWSRALPWGLLLVVTFFTLLFYWNYAGQLPSGARLEDQMELAAFQGAPVDSALSVDQADLSYFRTAPADLEDYAATVALLEEMAERNQASHLDPFSLEGAAGLNYRLFQLTQSGLLILGCLALGLAASDFEDSSTARGFGSTRILVTRAAVVFLSAALIFLAPKLLAALLAETLHGGGSLETLIPFNPKAGPGLYDYFDGNYLSLSRQRLVLAQSLTSVRGMFLSALLYELLQIFAWIGLGLMLGRLFLRKYPVMVLTAFFLFLAKSFSLPLNHFPPASFVFLIYQDALRDTLGSPDMVRGVVQSVFPLNYPLGLSVMMVSGIFFLYVTDLQLKGRLRRRRRGGDEDETI